MRDMLIVKIILCLPGDPVFYVATLPDTIAAEWANESREDGVCATDDWAMSWESCGSQH